VRWMLQQEAQRAPQPHPTVQCFHSAQVRHLYSVRIQVAAGSAVMRRCATP
jgi:hypothetical protein